MAVKLMLMHVPLQLLLSTVMQSHKTGRVQTSDRVLHTCCISLLAVGPRAPTTTLSRNCANEMVFPRGVDHSGCPRGEKERFPSLRIRSTLVLAPHTERKSALCALNGHPPTPPTPPKRGTRVRGAKGVKNEKFIGGSFSLLKR